MEETALSLSGSPSDKKSDHRTDLECPTLSYARALLSSVGAQEPTIDDADDAVPHAPPLQLWAASGAMALTGPPDGPPLAEPSGPAVAAAGALVALRSLALKRLPEDLCGPALLGERAALFGLERQGQKSPSGSCRLLRAADGWIAVNLPRSSDFELLPAWLGDGANRTIEAPWTFVAERVATGRAADLVARARLLGLAAATLPSSDEQNRHATSSDDTNDHDSTSPEHRWLRILTRGPHSNRKIRPPLVVDLSALWAGPLCGSLLTAAGADVIKVESKERPDGARFGPREFFDLLNAGKQSVALDFSSSNDRARLCRLVESADIVIESSRPRALSQLGIDASAIVRQQPGLVWVSITGYGRAEPTGNWIAYGDDAAVAAGLVAIHESRPLFCGDAIADPLTGLHAAVAALALWRQGSSALCDVSLFSVASHVAALVGGSASTVHVERMPQTPGANHSGWRILTNGGSDEVARPRARHTSASAQPFGADTDALLAGMGRGRRHADP